VVRLAGCRSSFALLAPARPLAKSLQPSTMSLPIVLNSQMLPPSAMRRRNSIFSGPDTDSEDEAPARSRPLRLTAPGGAVGRELATLESMLGGMGIGGLPVSLGFCRPPHPRDRVTKKVPLSEVILPVRSIPLLAVHDLTDSRLNPPFSPSQQGLCNCGACHDCRAERRARRNDPRRSLRDPTMKRLTGPVTPSPDYLRRAAVPSRPTQSDHPLLVISLDGVVDCRLPYHLSGGYTDVLSRPYLEPFLAYLLSQQSPWSFCFYSSLPRKQALKTLRELNMPTGGPEKDERDGVVGLFARDDMREGWAGGELDIKDLEVIWSELSACLLFAHVRSSSGPDGFACARRQGRRRAVGRRGHGRPHRVRLSSPCSLISSSSNSC